MRNHRNVRDSGVIARRRTACSVARFLAISSWDAPIRSFWRADELTRHLGLVDHAGKLVAQDCLRW